MNWTDKLSEALIDEKPKPEKGFLPRSQWEVELQRSQAQTVRLLRQFLRLGWVEMKMFPVPRAGGGSVPAPHYRKTRLFPK